MAIDHHARARKAWRQLVKCARAKQGNLISYGKLAGEQGLHHRSASWFLGVIQEYCADQNLPPLQALAVNRRTMLPGAGYRGSPTTAKLHQRAVKKVRSFAWPMRAPF